MKRLVSAALVMMAASLGADQGSTAASFLKLQTGPRAIAMGESFTGLSDDVNAIQYNPGGLGFVGEQQFTLMHATWFTDMYYDYGAIVSPFKGFGTIGLSAMFLNAGLFDKYVLDSGGNPQSQGTFGANSIVMGISYARVLVPSVSFGLNVKLLSETIDTASANGFSADFGVLYLTPLKGVSLGANVQNMGTNFGFDAGQAFELPLTLRLGVGYKPQSNVSLDIDYVQPKETVGRISIGGEYGYRDFLFLRLGYKYSGALDYDKTFTGYGPAIAAGLTMGVGFKIKNFLVDYAYSSYGFLGTPHRIALTIKF